MSQRIPANTLSNADIEYCISKVADDRAWVKYPQDAIHRENEINALKREFRENFLRGIEDAKAGKRSMPTVSYAEAGMERPQPQPRPPEAYNFQPKINLVLEAIGSLEPYSRRQLYRLGFLEHPQARQPTLTNGIIAPLALRHWNVSKSQKNVLDPVLRLASKMYLSPASVRFIHAMSFAEPVEETTSTRIWGLSLQEYGYTDAQNAPMEELVEPVLEGLKGVAKHISWGSMDLRSEQYRQYSNTCAVALRERKPTGSKRKGGDGAKILVSSRFIETLESLHHSPPGAPEGMSAHINMTLRLQLFIAKTICHELTHAVSFYLHPEWHRDPFFGPHSLTELGCTWEQEVLGGIVDWWHLDATHTLEQQLPDALSIRKWPATGDYGDYIFDQNPRARVAEFLRRYPKESTTVWYLDMRWIDGLFHDEFWGGAGADGDLELLKAPRSFGFRWTAADEEFTDRRWRRSLSSEARSVDSMGRVLLDRGLRGQLTP